MTACPKWPLIQAPSAEIGKAFLSPCLIYKLIPFPKIERCISYVNPNFNRLNLQLPWHTNSFTWFMQTPSAETPVIYHLSIYLNIFIYLSIYIQYIYPIINGWLNLNYWWNRKFLHSRSLCRPTSSSPSTPWQQKIFHLRLFNLVLSTKTAGSCFARLP